ncbi:hypothetical protein EOL94_03385 [bacterium]|nr:hypothetical protein [bacterium]
MKNLVIIAIFLSISSTSFSQSYYGEKVFVITNIQEVGFGKSSSCNEHLTLVVNGPLVHSNGQMVGGYIDNHNQVADWEEDMSQSGNFFQQNGIFGLTSEGQIILVPFEERNNLPKMIWAFQNGPMLIHRGEYMADDFSWDSKYIRSGIGFNDNNEIVVIYSNTPVSMPEFSRIFAEQGCKNAIYLDGGPYCGYAGKDGKHGSLKSQAMKIQFFH